MIAPLALLAALAAQGGPLSVEDPELRARIGLATGYDSNAQRLTQFDDEADRPAGDTLVRLRLDADGRLRTGPVRWTWMADLGTKVFSELRSEAMAAAQLRLASLLDLGGGWRGQLSGFGKARLQISGVRSYASSRADFFASHALGDTVLLRLGVSGAGFQSGDNVLFSSSTTGAHAGLTWFLGEREALDISLNGGLRAFPLLIPQPAPGEAGAGDNVSRVDAPLSARVALRSARAIHVQLRYALSQNSSNSFGEAFVRHRATAVVAFRLPAEVTATLEGAAQVTVYPEGISAGQQFNLDFNDENQNKLLLALRRPFIGGLSFEVRLARYSNELADAAGEEDKNARFERTTVTLGIRSEL